MGFLLVPRQSGDIRHGRHCVSALHVHLVFVTKYRRKVFDADALGRLQAIFEKVCRDFEAPLVEMNGEAEHGHLLINYPPKHSVSSVVNSLKGVSSRLLRIERPDMEKRYWRNELWTPSYFAASCRGAPLGMIEEYVRQQRTPLQRALYPDLKIRGFTTQAVKSSGICKLLRPVGPAG